MNQHIARLKACESPSRCMTALLEIETSLVVMRIQGHNSRGKRQRVIVIWYALALTDPDRVLSQEIVARHRMRCAKRIPVRTRIIPVRIIRKDAMT